MRILSEHRSKRSVPFEFNQAQKLSVATCVLPRGMLNPADSDLSLLEPEPTQYSDAKQLFVHHLCQDVLPSLPSPMRCHTTRQVTCHMR